MRRQKGRIFYTLVPKLGTNRINFQRKNNKINRARLGPQGFRNICGHKKYIEGGGGGGEPGNFLLSLFVFFIVFVSRRRVKL